MAPGRADPFEAVVRAVWGSLGLEAPRVDPEAMVLRIDGRPVRFAPSPNGAGILISAVAGRLAAEPARAEAQMRTLLREGLGLVLENRAAARLSREDGRTVVVEALGPARTEAVDLLRGLVEDVLYLADIHAPTLAAGASSPSQRPASAAHDHDSLIFRA